MQRMLPYLTYADVCWRTLTLLQVRTMNAFNDMGMKKCYTDVCWLTLTYALAGAHDERS